MLIGYARVATEARELSHQLDALSEAGCEQIFSDVASGARSERPGLTAAQQALRPGDVLVACDLSRVGRSMQHLVGLVDELQRRGVGFRVLSGQLDTTTASGRLVAHVFATLAEFERDLIRERTQVGLTSARDRGRLGGRPPKMTASRIKMAMTLLSVPGSKVGEVAEQLGVSVSTLSRYVDRSGSPRHAAERVLTEG